MLFVKMILFILEIKVNTFQLMIKYAIVVFKILAIILSKVIISVTIMRCSNLKKMQFYNFHHF